MASSAISGAALAQGSHDWCIGSLAGSTIVFVIQLIICIALRPYVGKFFFFHSITVQVIFIVSTALALASAYANAQPVQTPSTIAALSTASAVFSLLGVGVVAARALIDMRSLCIALMRLSRYIKGTKRRTTDLMEDASDPVI